MTVEYTLVGLFVAFLYAIVVQFLPDFPISDTVFQGIILYSLVKLGVTVAGKPSDIIRAYFAPKVTKKSKSK